MTLSSKFCSAPVAFTTAVEIFTIGRKPSEHIQRISKFCRSWCPADRRRPDTAVQVGASSGQGHCGIDPGTKASP